tara:strand:+ start:280 stop:744 length:465 start_codon:yes stop_codon:yes gene_type:complete
MKYIFIFLTSCLIFSSCKEEEIISSNVDDPLFTCNIDGYTFSDNTPTININVSDMMSIDLSDGTYTLSIRIYNFSGLSVNDVIPFSVPGMGIVSYNGSTYSSTYNGPPFDGEIIFTTLDSEKISGNFSFKSLDVDPSVFTNIWVTDGVFENITY